MISRQSWSFGSSMLSVFTNRNSICPAATAAPHLSPLQANDPNGLVLLWTVPGPLGTRRHPHHRHPAPCRTGHRDVAAVAGRTTSTYLLPLLTNLIPTSQ